MIMNRTRTIQIRLWLPISIFTVFTILLISFNIQQYLNFQNNIKDRTIVTLRERITSEGDKIYRLIDNNLEFLIDYEIADLNMSNEVQSVELLDENGIILKSSKAELINQSLQKCEIGFHDSIFRLAQQKNQQKVHLSDDEHHFFVYEPILLKSKPGEIRPMRIGLLFVDFNLTHIISSQRNRLFDVAIVTWIIGIILIMGLFFAFRYWLTIPFSGLQSIIKQFGEGNYNARVDYTGKGEFAEIGNAFNKMAEEVYEKNERLQALLEAEIKIKEELLIAKQKAEESDKLKSAFLANMSHEIRTPMNGILGFSGLLKEPNLSGEEQQIYIEMIEKSGLRMLNIINDIVDISKIESGLMIINIKELNINEQIGNIYMLFKQEVESKGMQLFNKNKLSNEEALIKTDAEKVYSILTNLIKNAIKYTSYGFIELGCERKGEQIEFFVKDTGHGIPKDRQEAIFERFIQADIEDKMATQGAGLGLAISKAYVEMLGGKIWLESEVEKGSIFYFTLPYNT
jgi:signal transduction histidine kinase